MAAMPSSSSSSMRPGGLTSSASSSSVRSRAQLNRRQSFTSKRRGGASSSRFAPTSSEQPLLGGLTFLDIIFIAVAYSVNLLKTLGIAEIADIAWLGICYAFTSLPIAFYQRWTRSSTSDDAAATAAAAAAAMSSSDDEDIDNHAKKQPHPVDESPPQLSPFHHLVILLTRFACSHFPHLLPRVLFAEETMLPFVGWRTGGASWGLMREVVGEGWKAVWLGDDAYSDSQRSASTTTILYLHGGGFSLGSVSFYAEALLRVLNKVSHIEGPNSPPPRCIAVEYDLSPTARFPQPLLQCLRCYAHLVEVEKMDPSCITFAGDSAGGNLAMSMLLVLSGQAKDQPALHAERDWSQLPMPGKALLISPWCDLRPREAHAFANLRQAEAAKESRRTPKRRHGQSATLADSMVSYDWDYVASETLLHFAQVYAGILAEPRRVAGPLGWLSHLCGVLGQGLEAERAVKPGKHARHHRKRKRGMRVMDPARRLAAAVNDLLERPIFERRGAAASSGALTEASSSTVSASAPSFSAGLQPLFTSRERVTRKVASTSQLHAPIDDDKGAGGDLDHNMLLSPVLGDWTQIHLPGGALVTWGERERLSADIESWVEVVHSGMTPIELQRGGLDDEDDEPRQDGHKELELRERKARGAWLQAAVEHGPGGVHAWPFVSMYLAGTEDERERGLETLARFVAKPAVQVVAKGANDHDYFAHDDGAQQEDEEFSFASGLSSPTFTSGDARIAAAGRRFTDEEYKEALGLGVSLGRGGLAASRPMAVAHSSNTTPGSSTTPMTTTPTTSRTPMSVTPPTTTPPSPSELARTPPLPHQLRGSISRRIDMERSTSDPPRGRRMGDSRPLWWTTTSTTAAGAAATSAGVVISTMTPTSSEEGSSEDITILPDALESERPAAPEPEPRAGSDDDDEIVQSHANVELDDRELDDGEAIFDSASSPPSTAAFAAPSSTTTSTAPLAINLHPSHFGLSYALRRDIEGLSDIAEESSVVSGSVASASSPSPGRSPLRVDDDDGEATVEAGGTGGYGREEVGELEEEEDDDDDDVAGMFSPQTRQYIRLEAERQLASENGRGGDESLSGTPQRRRRQGSGDSSRDAWWA